MRRWLSHIAIALTALSVLGCEGCGCSDSGVLAELVEFRGEVHRDWSGRKMQWTPVEQVEKFVVGDGLRAGASSNALLKLNAGSMLLVKEKTQIRFQTHLHRPGTKIFVEDGEAQIQVGDVAMELVTQLGVAVLEPRSKVTMRATDGGVGYRVEVGQATFSSGGDAVEVADAGDELFIRFGSGVIERIDEKLRVATEVETKKSGTEADGIAFSARGNGIRAREPDESTWQDVEEGSGRLPAGSAVRLPRDSDLRLQRGDSRVTLFGPGDFHLGDAGEPIVRAASGQMALEATNEPVTVLVPGGTITALGGAEEGTSARVALRKSDTRIDVDKGTVKTKWADGTREMLLAGQRGKLPHLAGGKVEATDFDAGPERVDFAVFAGESFMVHAARPPVSVAFRFGDKCPGSGVVQILGKRRRASQGTKKAHLVLPAGRSRYRLRCLGEDGELQDEVAAQGMAMVVRDAGQSRLPRRAPVSFVDADGRKYKIMYQNILPEVMVRWPNAPKANGYQLVISSKRQGTQRIPLGRPQHTFASGQLKEGVHSVHFEAADKGAVSKKTAVQIRFDNAAPKASVKQPAGGSFSPGDAVTVEGVAEPGWDVFVGSKEIALDASSRFSQTVQTSAQYDGIALRLTHPVRGIHYYLRRARGTNQ